jgi:hypothetical protein
MALAVRRLGVYVTLRWPMVAALRTILVFLRYSFEFVVRDYQYLGQNLESQCIFAFTAYYIEDFEKPNTSHLLSRDHAHMCQLPRKNKK